MTPRGGTEILYNRFQYHVNKELVNKVNLIISECNLALLSNHKPNILWQHVNTDQQVAFGIKNKNFVDNLDKIIFVSNWQMNKWVKEFDLPVEKCMVIRNAVEEVQHVQKADSSKIKLIYTSTPWRGLEVLVESFKLLNRNDIELDVYSSTVIYGKNFMPNGYKWLFDRCIQIPNINYKGYASNKAVVKACQNAHIFAYPSIFEETSCLAAIEAGAAGCKIVTTDLGALPETCDKYATYVSHTLDYDKLIYNYAEVLNKEIDDYYHNQELLCQQSNYFNEIYGWQSRKVEWENLLKRYA